MDFSFTDRQQQIVDDVIAMCKQLDQSDLTERDRDCEFSREMFDSLAAAGINHWLFAENHRGQSFGAVDLAIALETLGEHCQDTGMVFAVAAHLCACIHPLVHYGNDLQLENWSRKIQDNGWLGAHAITELNAGSDVYAMQTRAEPQGDGFVINGEKTYITNAPVADFIVVHARTADRGNLFDLSSFILETNTPGVTVSEKPFSKVGLRTTAMGAVSFDNVYLGKDALLGRIGSGGPIFQVCMEWERTCLFALYLGVMKRQLALTIKRCEQREQFGEAIIENQTVAHKLVDMFANYESCQTQVYKAAWCLDQGELDGLSAAVAKISIAQTMLNNSLDAMELHGAWGILEGEIERQMRNALPASIFSGANATLKNNMIKQLRRKYARLKYEQSQPIELMEALNG